MENRATTGMKKEREEEREQDAGLKQGVGTVEMDARAGRPSTREWIMNNTKEIRKRRWPLRVADATW